MNSMCVCCFREKYNVWGELWSISSYKVCKKFNFHHLFRALSAFFEKYLFDPNKALKNIRSSS